MLNRPTGPLPDTVLAVTAGAAAFAVSAGVCSLARHHVPALLLGAVLLVAALVTARAAGVLFALPVGVAAILAYDWFFLPPLRIVNVDTFLVLGLFIGMAAIVGAVAEAANRRSARYARARDELLQEQVALRRVATLVAGGAQPEAVFTAIADELADLIAADVTLITRIDEAADTVTVVGSFGAVTEDLPVGTTVELGPTMLLGPVAATGETAQVTGDGLRDSPFRALIARMGLRMLIATPIVVGTRRWGVAIAGTTRDGFPDGTASRIRDFIHLAALAIGNAQAVQELREMAEAQASLRRLALLVARGVAPAEIFGAVTKEVLRRFGSRTARLVRYELDGAATLLANEGTTGPHVRVGEAWEGYPPTGLTASVQRTGQTVRVDDIRDVPGAQMYLDEGLMSAVGMPIHANGRLWGMIAIGWGQGQAPTDTEARMAEFTELTAVAVASAQSRAELIGSRARLVAAADEARRRIERDLHDGAQQRLVALALRLRTTALHAGRNEDVHAEVEAVAGDIMVVIDELRELSRGIHPAVLSDSGLRPALRALARRSPLPVEVEVRPDGRLPELVEIGAYYVVSEALTNAVKHAQAEGVRVEVDLDEGVLSLLITDDGRGGADPAGGSGLLGLKDRIEALGGTFELRSPPGGGTTIRCRVPVRDHELRLAGMRTGPGPGSLDR